MPNVPNVPGVPPLSSYAPNNIALLFADITFALNSLFGSQWGIYGPDGLQAFDYQSIIDFDYKQDWPTSDYPIEEGGFQSYDKVELPFDVKVRVVSGGSEGERQALLDSVHAAAGTLDLFTVVTPEKTYPSCNISHIDYKRSASSGVGMVMIDIWFIEIRESATANFTTTQSPANAGQVNTGNVSPQEPSGEITRSFNNGTRRLQ